MNIALVHDHLAQNGGAENILRAFCEIWPEAPVYTLLYNSKNAHPFFQKKEIHTSFIQNLPFGVKKYQWFFSLMPAAVENFDFSAFDVVLSSSSSFAKGIITRPHTLHITYCHTPTRFLWSDTHSYVAELGANRVLKKILPLFLSHVRLWDRIASERANFFIANSHTVRGRIKKYYHRESDVIHPFVDEKNFSVGDREQGTFFLTGGRLVPYKRFDIVVEAFNKLKKPLKIFGDGPMRKMLAQQALPNIQFVGRVTDEKLANLYRSCAAFINPQEEDFGITILEAMAGGRPVIAYRRGGAKEIMEEGKTGHFFDFQDWQELVDTILRFDPNNFSPEIIRAHALTFSKEKFKKNIEEYVNSKWENFHN